MVVSIIIVLSVMLVIGYILLCVNIIGPNEQGVRVFLGKPNRNAGALNSGFHLVFFPFEKIVRFSKERMVFKFTTKTVVTKRGKVAGHDDEDMEPAELNLECAVYASFDLDNLFTALERAPGRNAKQLGPYIVPYVIDAVRALCGRIPWRLINQERYNFAQWIIGRMMGDIVFKDIDVIDDRIGFYKDNQTLDRELIKDSSPFLIFGLKDVDFAILDVNFSDPEIQKAVSAPEKARLNKKATITDAKAQKAKTILEGEGSSQKIRLDGAASAEARQLMINIIKENPDLEVLFTLREMAQGTSNTLFFQLPGAFEEKVKGLLGGKGLEDIFELLREEDKKKVKDYVVSLGKGGKK